MCGKLQHIMFISPCEPSAVPSAFSGMPLLQKTLVPLGDRVLVQRVVTATETKSGVLLPESSVKKTNEGSVVEVGPGVRPVKASKSLSPVLDMVPRSVHSLSAQAPKIMT